jgi:uncharacterized membrane protein YqjE
MKAIDPAYLSMAGQIIAYIVSIVIAIWRVSARFAKHEEILKNTTDNLRAVIKSQREIIKDLGAIEVKMVEREKDIAKVEVGIDSTRRDIYDLIKETQKSQSKIDALWATVQGIFPDKVPKRLSDTIPSD